MSAATELLRFIALFVLIGVQVVIYLENVSGGVNQSEERVNETSIETVGLWTFCVQDKYGVSLINKDVSFLMTFRYQVCLESFDDLKNSTGFTAVPQYPLLLAGRWLLVCCFPIFLVLLMLHVASGRSSKCPLKVIIVLLLLGYLLQIIVMVFMICVWKSRDGLYELGWPWIMSFVAVGLLSILLIFTCVNHHYAPETKPRHLDQSSEPESKFVGGIGVITRWIFIVLFLPALVLQFVVHIKRGASMGESGEQVYMGIWWYCLDGSTQVQMGAFNSLRNLSKPNLCILFTQSTDVLASWEYLAIARISVIMTHFTSISSFYLAILCKHAKSPRQKFLFYARFVLCFFAFVFITVSAALTTVVIPDGFSMDVGFICLWVSCVVVAVIFTMCLVQTCCQRNFLGEIRRETRSEEDVSRPVDRLIPSSDES